MGLHLNYRLTLPGATSADDVRGILTSLKEFASTLDFDQVLGPSEHTLDELTEPGSRDIVAILVSAIAGDPPDFYGIAPGAPCAFAFLVLPGKECEPAVLGFMAPGSRARYEDFDDDMCPGDWFWSASCKTQYASLVSNDHLVKCHTTLVRLLDHAATLGITVQVEDETGYWVHRSSEKLIAAVEDMNRLMARFAGALSDRLGDAHKIEAPIFDHPEFEHLEMESCDPERSLESGHPERSEGSALPRDQADGSK